MAARKSVPAASTATPKRLRRSLPDVQFFEYRDFIDFADVKSDFEKASICFLLPHQLELLPDKYIDLIINISSFHEMLPAQIKKYYDIINKKTSYFYTKQWLFWENPDDKIVVPAVIYPTNPEWQLMAARLNPVHTTFFRSNVQNLINDTCADA